MVSVSPLGCRRPSLGLRPARRLLRGPSANLVLLVVGAPHWVADPRDGCFAARPLTLSSLDFFLVSGTEYKKIPPLQMFCWDRIKITILRCHPAWRNINAPTLRIPTYAGLCLQSAISVSHTPESPVSDRPQKPIGHRLFRRNSTACGSLKKKFSMLTYSSSTVY